MSEKRLHNMNCGALSALLNTLFLGRHKKKPELVHVLVSPAQMHDKSTATLLPTDRDFSGTWLAPIQRKCMGIYLADDISFSQMYRIFFFCTQKNVYMKLYVSPKWKNSLLDQMFTPMARRNPQPASGTPSIPPIPHTLETSSIFPLRNRYNHKVSVLQ